MSPPLPWRLHFRKHGNTRLVGCLKDLRLSAQFHLFRTMILSHEHHFPCHRGGRLHLLNVPLVWTTWLTAPTNVGGGYHVAPGWSPESSPVPLTCKMQPRHQWQVALREIAPFGSLSLSFLWHHNSFLVSCKAFQGSILGTRGKPQKGQTNAYTGASQELPYSGSCL